MGGAGGAGADNPTGIGGQAVTAEPAGPAPTPTSPAERPAPEAPAA